MLRYKSLNFTISTTVRNAKFCMRVEFHTTFKKINLEKNKMGTKFKMAAACGVFTTLSFIRFQYGRRRPYWITSKKDFHARDKYYCHVVTCISLIQFEFTTILSKMLQFGFFTEGRVPFWLFGPYGCPHNISDYNHHLFLLFGMFFRHLNGWLAFIQKIPEQQNFRV